MTEDRTPKPKKIGEGNKSLSVIVAEDKLVKFKAFSQGINLSMGWLLNQAIDRYLSSESTDIFKSSLGDSDNTPKLSSMGAANMEELIRTSIDNYLLKNSIGKSEQNLPLSKSDVEEMINSFIGIHEVQKLVNQSIEIALEPIEADVAQLKKPLAIG